MSVRRCAAELFACISLSIWSWAQFSRLKWQKIGSTYIYEQISNIELLDKLRIYQNYFSKFSDISIDLKYVWNIIYGSTSTRA